MCSYSYLLFLSSVLAADNNTLAHMAQEQLNIQVQTILFLYHDYSRGMACPRLSTFKYELLPFLNPFKK